MSETGLTVVLPASDGEIKPLRAVLRLKNNAIIERRERLGYESCARFCREMDLPYSPVVALETAYTYPFCKNGELKAIPARLCEALAATPEDLWPTEVLALRKNVTTLLLDGHDLRALPGFSVAAIDERSVEQRVSDKSIAARALSLMSQRDAYVVRRRIFDGATLEEIGDEMSLSRERVRALMYRGLEHAKRKLSKAERESLSWDWE